jgi:signal transduction histidine kinase
MTAWPRPRHWREMRTSRRVRAMPRNLKSWPDKAAWAYVLVCVPFVLLVIEVLRGTVYETQDVRLEVLRDAIHEVDRHTMQRAKGLEVLMEAHEAGGMPLEDLCDEPWLREYWSSIKPSAPQRIYAAVVDEGGKIVLHTDPDRVGERLERGWYERRVPEVGANVVWTQHGALSGERPTYDISATLIAGGRSIGDYHEGVDAQWLESEIRSQQRGTLAQWLAVLAVVGTAEAGAMAALIYLSRRHTRLRRRLSGEHSERARDMAQLGSGLAHEIRNPLHALRINLHTLRRALGGRSQLSEQQIVDTIDDSDSAISRLDGLMRDLLQYSDPSSGQVVEVEVGPEVEAALKLLAEDFRRDNIQVAKNLPDLPTAVAIDPVRLRQLLHNVLTFAQHRAGKNGTIEVCVARSLGGVEITVGDSGPLLAVDKRARIFEPFQAPAETGSGLGLALVQLYAEEAGGQASWDGASAGGRCRVWLPLATPGDKGGPS